MTEVETFARQWGFLPTRFLVMNSMQEVNAFTRTIAETGKWQGTAIEGFVVRTRMPSDQDPVEAAEPSKALVAPPYAKGQTWFYKIKFDEPYLMYRDWRELTRKMLFDKEAFETDPRAHQAKRPEPPNVKKKRPETQLFVQWCYEQMHGSADGTVPARPDLFEGLSQNAGIIRLRQLFIEYMSTEGGQVMMKQWKDPEAPSNLRKGEEPFTRTLIVPVAIPGCGKTALGVALTSLFKCIYHTQSDDVQTKRTGPTFLRNIAKALDDHDVVYADRNNHQYKHRDEIVKCALDWEATASANRIGNAKSGKKRKEVTPAVGQDKSNARRVRLIALVWPIEDLPLNFVHHLCCDRVVERGINHQSLRFEQGTEHEQVLWHFLQTRQEFHGASEAAGEEVGGGDQAFHKVIQLDIRLTLDEMVHLVAQQLSDLLSLPLPSQEDIMQATEQARQYRVSVKKESKGIVGAPVRYYGLSVEVDVANALQPLVEDDAQAKSALDRLVSANRVNPRPHVTLVHNSELQSDSDNSVAATTAQKQAQKRWDCYSSLHQHARTAPQFTMQVDCLAWDDRAMSLGVSHVFNEDHAIFDSLQGAEWRPHITVGTFHEDVRPYEGNRVLREADVGSSQVSCIRFKEPLSVVGRLRGLT